MRNIYALDLGTTKFCIAKYDLKDPTHAIELVSAPSSGMRRGMLADFEQVSQGINNLIQKAEYQFKDDIRHVVIGVAGSHLKGQICETSAPIQGGKVSSKTLTNMERQIAQETTEPGREIVHSVAIAHSIDKREPVPNPLGLCGRLLKSQYFVIDADQLYLKDVINAANHAGIEVLNLFAEPYASACVTVPDNAKQMGIAIADIGGGTTDGIVYIEGQPTSCFSFSIGGLMMTNDIAIGLNIPFEEAEKAKNYFGISALRTEQTLGIKDFHGRPRTLSGYDVQRILGYRVIEWAENLSEQLRSYRGRLGAGILLSGGGSMVLALTDILEKQFGLPVKTTFPSFDFASVETTYAASYATVLGLLQLKVKEEIEKHLPGSHQYRFPLLRSLANWVRDFS